MTNLWNFIKTAFLGGVTVLLPSAILVLVFQWIFRVVTNLIQPLSRLIANLLQPLIDSIPFTQLHGLVTDLLAITIIFTFCFTVGVVIKTRLGRWLFHHLEHSLLRIAPGYTTVKEIVMQLFGNKKPPFSRVALVRLFGNSTLVTAFITDEHDDGSFTVFVPTGPNPTSGWMFHVPAEEVFFVDVSVEATMRTIIGCGVGSKTLIADHNRKRAATPPDPS